MARVGVEEDVHLGDDLDAIFPARLTPATVERARGDFEDLAHAMVFVPWPTPPRVGCRVGLDLAFGDEAPQRLPARVVAAQAGRGPVTAGFKAALVAPPPQVLAKLQALLREARGRLPPAAGQPSGSAAARQATPNGQPIGRVTLIPVDPGSLPMTPVPPSKTAPTPETPPAEEPFAIDLPEDNEPLELSDQGAVLEMSTQFRQSASATPALEIAGLDWEPAALPETPAPRSKADRAAPPERSRAWVTPPPVAPPALVRPAPPPLLETPPARQTPVAVRPAPAARRVRVNIQSAQSFRVHYRRFLARGEAYCVEQPAPPAGSVVELQLDIPDGEPPLCGAAVVERMVAPPEVPLPGFVVSLVDPEDEYRERLSQAALILGS